MIIDEAMENGLPVVVSISGRIANALKDDWSAVLVDCSAELITNGIRCFR